MRCGRLERRTRRRGTRWRTSRKGLYSVCFIANSGQRTLHRQMKSRSCTDIRVVHGMTCLLLLGRVLLDPPFRHTPRHQGIGDHFDLRTLNDQFGEVQLWRRPCKRLNCHQHSSSRGVSAYWLCYPHTAYGALRQIRRGVRRKPQDP